MKFLDNHGYHKDLKSDTLPIEIVQPSDYVPINFRFDLLKILQEINVFFEIHNVLNLALLLKNSP